MPIANRYFSKFLVFGLSSFTLSTSFTESLETLGFGRHRYDVQKIIESMCDILIIQREDPKTNFSFAVIAHSTDSTK